MSYKEVRKGVTNAKFNEDSADKLIGEILLIAIGLGLYASSWWVFGGVLLGLMIAFSIPPIALVLVVIFSLGWAVIGYFIGSLFNSTGASIVLSILGFISSLSIHLSAIEWVQDIGTGEESNNSSGVDVQ